MFFEPCVTVVGPYSKIQDLKTNMEDSKTMTWRNGGSWGRGGRGGGGGGGAAAAGGWGRAGESMEN